MIVKEYTFINHESIGPNQCLLQRIEDDVKISIFRSMRTDPLPGMKQPALNGAILGMETVCVVVVPKSYKKPKLVLYRENKKVKTYQVVSNKSISLDVDIADCDVEFSVKIDAKV